MKQLLAILFSVMLVWAQGAAALGLAAAPAKVDGSTCCQCTCGGAKCCVDKGASAPAPFAATTAPSSCQPSQLLSPAATSFTLAPLHSSTSSLSASAAGVPRPAPVPLYERNCVFLI